DNDLAAPAAAPGGLDAHRPKGEQARPRTARVAQRERREAGEHHVAHTGCETVRPANRRRRIWLDERVGDRLGRDERVGDDTAEKVILRTNTEGARLVVYQRVA